MNIPNKLTISRMLLSIAFIGFLFGHGLVYKALALATFTIATLTDLLDGYLAKKYNQVTDFGRLMDPIADKVLVLSAFLAFVEMGIVPAWMVVVIIFREVAITGLRMFALSRGRVLAADGGGKHKTVWQMIAIFTILIYLIFGEAGMNGARFWTTPTQHAFQDVIYGVMAVTVAMTLGSGIVYLVKNRGVYAGEKKG